MGNRFTIILMALVAVFLGGWLFANEYPPPQVADLKAAAWIVSVLMAVVLASMATGGATR